VGPGVDPGPFANGIAQTPRWFVTLAVRLGLDPQLARSALMML